MDGRTMRLGGADELPTYRRLLGARLYVHCRLRAGAALTTVLAALFAEQVLDIDLDVGALCVVAVLVALYNLAPWMQSRPFRARDVTPEEYPRIVALALGAIALDYLALTAVIWHLGGCRSPFVPFYLLHMIFGAVLFSRRSALAMLALAQVLLTALVLGELTGVAPPRLPAGVVAGTGPLEERFALTLVVVYALLFGLTSFLLLEVSRRLRNGELRIRIANDELRRLSDQRRDFLHVTMHNLKAPLGAVTMLLRNVLDGLAGPTTDEQREWLERSVTRLGGLTDLLADMQALAALDHAIATNSFRRVELDGLLARLREQYADVARERGLALDLDVERPVHAVLGHERLLEEAVVNYVTNALRYAPPGGRVELALFDRGPTVRLEVRDDGEGVAPEDRERLFGEFERGARAASRDEGVKGAGLGLSIVKRIVEAHDGRAGVAERAGGGAVFFIELPPLLE